MLKSDFLMIFVLELDDNHAIVVKTVKPGNCLIDDVLV